MGIGGVEAVGGEVTVRVINVAAASVGQLKLNARQGFASGLVQLADDKLASPLVPEGKLGCALTCPDLHALGSAIQHKTVHRFDLLGGDGGSGFQALDHDLALAVGVEDAVAGADRRAAAVHHLEGHASQRLVLRSLNILVDRQSLFRGIFKIQIISPARDAGDGCTAGRAARTAGQGVGPVADNDGLGSRIQNIAAGDFGLHHDHGAVGSQSSDSGGTILPGGAGGEDVAVAVLYRKAGTGDRLSGHRVQLGDRQRTQRLIEEG